MPCVGTGVLAKKLTQPMIVSQASRQDVIIMKDSVLECHGVEHTTLGDFLAAGKATVIFFSFLAFKFSTVLTSKNVMKQIKGRCRKRPRRWTRWEIYYLPSLLLRTRQRCGSTGGEGFTDMLSQAVR